MQVAITLYVTFLRKHYLRKEYGRLKASDAAAFFINDEADTRTNDIPMNEIVIEAAAVTNYETVTEDL